MFIADQDHLGAAGQHRVGEGGFLAQQVGGLNGQAEPPAETQEDNEEEETL